MRESLGASPAFTKVLANGLGLAEDPGGNTSFGMHRCELLAALLCHSAAVGLKTTDEKLAFIDEAFGSAGYSLDTPYLNPGSSDHYQIPFPATEAVTQVAVAKHIPATDPVPPSAEESLAMAVKLGGRLTDSAIWYEDRCNWLSSTVDGNILSHGASGPDLYSGLTGIGWFLAELAAVTGGDGERHTALAALRNALTIADNMLHPIPFDALYSGPIGFALIALRAGALLGDEQLAAQARALISRRPRPAEQKLPDFDMMAGFAGTITGLVILGEQLADHTLLETATELGDALIAHGEQSHGRSSWKSPYMAKFRNLTGFSHGAAGAAFALLELFDATREERFRAAAESAFAYERYWFDERTQNWPDFRGVPASAKRADITFSSETAWCHGAPGIALSRLRAYELLDMPGYKAEAEVALRTTLRSTEGMLASGVGNYSLCHGMTGNAEVLRYGAQLLGGEWRSIWADVNGRIAAAGIATHGSGRLPWRSGGPIEGPGLMVGLAGIGYYYLRQCKPTIPSPLLLLRHEFAPQALALGPGKVGAMQA
ncbi:MAG: hypothetical protein JWN15_1971 [Firmicutes bacterium]|nr:hypothetical protein [Bacillota bacterium]